MRLRSTVANGDRVFYTDLNGLQLVQRKMMDKLPLQGNFYPMPTTALLQDQTHRLSLLTAQAHGVASLETGWLEAVLDRRLAKDDERGLGQGVKDNKVTAANFRLLLETRTQPAGVPPSPQLVFPSLFSVVTMDTLLHPPHISFTSSHSKILSYLPSSLSLLSHPLPCDIFLLNLRSSFSGPDSALLLHRRGYDCGFLATPESCSVSNGMVELKTLFKGTDVATATEMSLSLLHEKGPIRTPDLSVHIPPMEIQTYSVTWAN
jgi:alpha-mannosidase II